MPHGLLVVNAFLRTTKFDELYQILLCSARECGMELSVHTNAELSAVVDGDAFDAAAYDFVLFWDKDVALATQLEQRGLPVFNSAESILRCDDKALTYLTLKRAGLPMPRTILAPKTFAAVGYPHTAFVDAAADALGFPLVLKECFGSFGQQVYLFDEREALRAKVVALAGTPLLFQALVRESWGRDIRVNVVGDRVVASILRHSRNGDFRSNLTLGGDMESYTPSPAEAALALRAVRELGLTFAGVDVLFGRDGPLICEVNSNAHFKTTLACTGVNMATELLREIKRRLEASR
ncbi:MAG: RimK family alpha-L-glutamate ligase [Clostridiales bacterium]|nr:RimK family alpha-L-glutamate ligase [Clostridiales bacterium]